MTYLLHTFRYEDVYESLMKELRWSRVGALTEDGQKYTEYISHMVPQFKKSGIIIINKKFPRELSKTASMTEVRFQNVQL